MYPRAEWNFPGLVLREPKRGNKRSAAAANVCVYLQPRDERTFISFKSLGGNNQRAQPPKPPQEEFLYPATPVVSIDLFPYPKS